VKGPSAEARHPKLRAEEAVMDAVEQPRTGRLASVLATLQPDQYRLVTWTDSQPMIVQGQPGTGKTVIAVHRAAYLVHPERETGRPLTRVLLVGPTDEYVSHVRNAVEALYESQAEVAVTSLPRLLSELAGLGTPPRQRSNTELDDTNPHIAALALRAGTILRAQIPRAGDHASRVRTLATALIKGDAAIRGLLGEYPNLRSWLKNLGNWSKISADGRYLPFLAGVGLAVRPIPEKQRFDHILVDEGQDVHLLEWEILRRHLSPDSTQAISIFGDINQRRTDWSVSSWSTLMSQLRLGDSPASTVQELQVAYRSTELILKFANQLLPRGEAMPVALRRGVDPTVKRVDPSDLVGAALDSAESLIDRHPEGLVAVIAMNAQQVSDRLRRKGWSRSDHRWTKNDRNLLVLQPDNARGLEFDGVVVVEPTSFPTNVGRLGLLYTSLTRATQELTVVHAQPLPRELRAPRR
jgi:DNA helicase IV